MHDQIVQLVQGRSYGPLGTWEIHYHKKDFRRHAYFIFRDGLKFYVSLSKYLMIYGGGRVLLMETPKVVCLSKSIYRDGRFIYGDSKNNARLRI